MTNQFRHGSRYPSFGATTSKFADEIHAAANNATTGGFDAKGPLAFLNSWTYNLGAELLTPFGRQQLFVEGVAARLMYGHLLNNFTESNQLPLLRTESQDRMVKSAQNFAAGFFGIPADDQYNLLIQIEADGFNTTGAGYDNCPNDDLDPGYLGSDAQSRYYAKRYPPTVARLNSFIDGFTFDVADVNSMMQLCAYESIALGYSKFCEIFTEEEFKVRLIPLSAGLAPRPRPPLTVPPSPLKLCDRSLAWVTISISTATHSWAAPSPRRRVKASWRSSSRA